MIVSRTYDASVIKQIMTRPDIWKTVSEDGQKAEAFEPDMGQNCFLLISDNEVIGLYQLKCMNGVTIELHPMVFPECRSEYGKASCQAVLQWIVDNVDWCQKVNATIPVIYKHVKRFAKSMGFVEEGINRKSYIKDGVLVDQYLLGITREEILQ